MQGELPCTPGSHRPPPPASSLSRLFSSELGRSPVLRLETPNPKPTEPAAQQAARSLPERQPPSPGPLARQPGMTSAPCLGEGCTAQECRRGLGRWPPRELASAPVFFFFVLFFFLPLSLNSLARCPSGTSCARLLTHPRQHRAGTRVSARVWGHVRGRRLPRGGGGAAAARASRASGEV